MEKRFFHVRACWDPEAKVFYSESDIDGLAIEAETIDEFETVMLDVAVELILANTTTAEQRKEAPLKDLVPAILWQRPEENTVCA